MVPKWYLEQDTHFINLSLRARVPHWVEGREARQTAACLFSSVVEMRPSFKGHSTRNNLRAVFSDMCFTALL